MEIEGEEKSIFMGSFANEYFQKDDYDHKEVLCERENDNIEYKNSKYLVPKMDFTQQYYNLYNERLKQMRPFLKQASQLEWPGVVLLDEIRQLKSDMESVIVGTVCVTLKKYKSILDESLSVQFNPQTIGSQFLNVNNIQDHLTSEDDIITLEDEISKIVLSGNIKSDSIVNGCTIAVRGMMEKHGYFIVTDICFPSIPYHIPLSSTLPASTLAPTLALISGVNIGKTEKLLETQMFVDYITGILGGEEDHQLCRNISRVLFVGNSTYINREPFRRIRLDNKEIENSIEPITLFDQLISPLVSSVDVDIIPGRNDASSVLLPQQPLHPFFFTNTSSYSSLHTCTNPCEIDIYGYHILLCSGFIIEDLKRQLEGTPSTLTIMKYILQWGILCPTAPNSCETYPFVNKDPFVLSQIPNIFIVGNQQKFETEMYKNKEGASILLISLPSFSSIPTAAFLNLKDLTCESIDFETQL
ncbi:hypothetical protein WA158_005232 [Blastocystis sp. Blastoise]